MSELLSFFNLSSKPFGIWAKKNSRMAVFLPSAPVAPQGRGAGLKSVFAAKQQKSGNGWIPALPAWSSADEPQSFPLYALGSVSPC